MTSWVVVLGLALGLGLSSLVSWGRARSLSLEVRVAPQLRAVWNRGDLVEVDPCQAGQGFFRGALSAGSRNAAHLAERWGSPSAELAPRLRRAGLALAVPQYRAEQVVWGVAGAVMGLFLAGALASRGASPVPLVAMVVAFGFSGAAARDVALTRTIRRREERILVELPTVADMLALSVSAGEGALGAIERIARMASGVLVEELRSVVGEIRTGTPVADSLHALSERTGVAALSRFASGVAIAVERGTPLADVLHAQALDVREAGRRRLIEEGGKREIAMMIPVIFLILPVTVVFAVFPGIVAIHLGN